MREQTVGKKPVIITCISTTIWIITCLFKFTDWANTLKTCFDISDIISYIILISVSILLTLLIYGISCLFINYKIIKKKFDIEQSETGLREILEYWGVRTDEAAQNDMKKYLKETKSEVLLISAIGFGTLKQIFKTGQDDIINNFVPLMIKENSRFKLRIIFPENDNDWIDYTQERGDNDITDNIKEGRSIIKNFVVAIDEKLKTKIPAEKYNKFDINKYIELRYYNKINFLPRHFILRGNDIIFVGSYLNHQKGERSHLLKLQKLPMKDPSLFDLFASEADFLCQDKNSTKLTFEDFIK